MNAVGYSDFEPLSKGLWALAEIAHFYVCSKGDFCSEAYVADDFGGGDVDIHLLVWESDRCQTRQLSHQLTQCSVL